jgi:hypothetical protein
MKGVARNKAAFIAMKAGVAASSILATRNMAAQQGRAIATMVAINSAHAMVAATTTGGATSADPDSAHPVGAAKRARSSTTAPAHGLCRFRRGPP